MFVPTSHRKPVLLGLAASAGLTALVIVGSRNLEHYDPALFGYTVASVAAFGAIVLRYSIWLGRPATRVYWRRGWRLFRDRSRLAAHTRSAVRTLAHNLIAQRFIAKRGFSRWAMHAGRGRHYHAGGRKVDPCGSGLGIAGGDSALHKGLHIVLLGCRYVVDPASVYTRHLAPHI